MGLRGPHARPLSIRHRPQPNPRRKHRFLCRECRKPFVAHRDDARFCSAACKQSNYRRQRGPISVTAGGT
jgi:hypothetical protein